MFKIIKRIFSKNMNYHYCDYFYSALEFTAAQNFSPDEKTFNWNDEGKLREIVADIASLMHEPIKYFKNNGFNPIIKLGGECGNIHLSFLRYVKKYYPSVPVNLTIGEVRTEGNVNFSFDEDKFIAWLAERPKILDCHVWITVGNKFIIDATIGTYLNTRIENIQSYGCILYGLPWDLSNFEIPSVINHIPKNLKSLEFRPVVLGEGAFIACAPAAPF